MSLADDIIDGECCALCTEPFLSSIGDPVEFGYPCICENCAAESPEHGYSVATKEMLG